MSDLPKAIAIKEEGPREGFQIEAGPISTERKIELIDALSETGLKRIQMASFVNPKRVPGWADAEEVIAGIKRYPGVKYSAIWLNEKGLERALVCDGLEMKGGLSTTTSETFMAHNTNRGFADNRKVQRNQALILQKHNIPVEGIGVMTAFGCNFEGDISTQKVIDAIADMMEIADDLNEDIKSISLADTMGWATPISVKRVIGAVRDRWPDVAINLHLHNTRGLGIASAFAGLEMGVTSFDSSVGGLGGCPFAKVHGAAGNVSTEELVFLCEEIGIETGVDLDKLVDTARLAEDIVGHPLPSNLVRGGTLSEARANQA